MLARVVRVSWVRLERDFGRALRAPHIKAKDLHAQIVFAPDGLFASVELAALVDVLAAGVAAKREREHKADRALGAPLFRWGGGVGKELDGVGCAFWNGIRVKVGWDVLVDALPLGHCKSLGNAICGGALRSACATETGFPFSKQAGLELNICTQPWSPC